MLTFFLSSLQKLCTSEGVVGSRSDHIFISDFLWKLDMHVYIKGKNFKIVDNDRKKYFSFLTEFQHFFTNESFITNASFRLIVRLSEKVF